MSVPGNTLLSTTHLPAGYEHSGYRNVRQEGWIFPANVTQSQLPPGASLADMQPLNLWRKPAARVRVRFHIIRNARIKTVCKYQSCMVSKLRIIWKQTVLTCSGADSETGAVCVADADWVHGRRALPHTAWLNRPR